MVLGGLVVVVVVLVVVAGSGSSIRYIIVNTTINVVAAMLTEKCRLWGCLHQKDHAILAQTSPIDMKPSFPSTTPSLLVEQGAGKRTPLCGTSVPSSASHGSPTLEFAVCHKESVPVKVMLHDPDAKKGFCNVRTCWIISCWEQMP